MAIITVDRPMTTTTIMMINEDMLYFFTTWLIATWVTARFRLLHDWSTCVCTAGRPKGIGTVCWIRYL